MDVLKNKIFLKVLGLTIIVFLYAMTVPSVLNDLEKKAAKDSFDFFRMPLMTPDHFTKKYIRKVHPQYKHIESWISSVGAAVAFTDIDNDDLYNDIINVDPRIDKVIVSCADHVKYDPIVLDEYPLYFEKETMAPMGILPNDYDHDGNMDVLVYYWGRTPIIWFQKETGFIPKELLKESNRWFSNAGTLGDFDGNGYTDILITNYFPDGAKVLDGDSKDKEQVMQHSMSRAFNGGTNHLFLARVNGNGEVVYEENKSWNKDLKHPNDWTLAVGAQDINGDMLPEIYFANDFGPDKLLHNVSKNGTTLFESLKGKRTLTSIASGVIGNDSFKGMGVDFGDINQDDIADLCVSNIAAEYALEESHFAFIGNDNYEEMNNQKAPFTNEAEKLGLSRSSWGWDIKIADFNNDGQNEILQATGFVKGKINGWAELQELALGNDELLSTPEVWPQFNEQIDLCGKAHNPFFYKSKTNRFFDISDIIGTDEHQVTRGIAIGDVDHDGDLDFAYANQWEDSYFYLNRYKGGGVFLGLNLKFPIESQPEKVLVNPEEKKMGRPSIGAKATLYLPNGKTMTDYVDGGNGHSGVNSPEIFFGLGNIDPDQELKLVLEWINANGDLMKKSLVVTPDKWYNLFLKFYN